MAPVVPVVEATMLLVRPACPSGNGLTVTTWASAAHASPKRMINAALILRMLFLLRRLRLSSLRCIFLGLLLGRENCLLLSLWRRNSKGRVHRLRRNKGRSPGRVAGPAERDGLGRVPLRIRCAGEGTAEEGLGLVVKRSHLARGYPSVRETYVGLVPNDMTDLEKPVIHIVLCVESEFHVRYSSVHVIDPVNRPDARDVAFRFRQICPVTPWVIVGACRKFSVSLDQSKRTGIPTVAMVVSEIASCAESM